MDNIVWSPTQELLESSAMAELIRQLNNKYQLTLEGYQSLHQWSVDYPELFWGFLWDFLDITYSKSYTDVCRGDHFYDTEWFVGAELNYAENCLKHSDDLVAIIGVNEHGQVSETTYAQLRSKVSCLQQFLMEKGIQKGDRVVGLVTHCEEAIVCFLACASLGAIWSSCSTEFASDAVLSRFGQLDPKCFIFSESYTYKQRSFSTFSTVSDLCQSLESCDILVSLQTVSDVSMYSKKVYSYVDILNDYSVKDVFYVSLKSSDPLYVLFSSGTTGQPKAIVHSVGGTLIEHLKEYKLHCNATSEDVVFYYTTTAWMMWNWLVSGLTIGASIVVFDGAPFFPDDLSTWRLIDTYNISIYGTSAKFINASFEKRISPRQDLDLSSLRLILSTGSVLTEEDFDYVYKSVKSDVQLASISGGTDIVGCFALGNPLLPVYRGFLQSVSLGYNVQAYSDSGKSCLNQKGELVCVAPFPSMPVGFWNDFNNEKFKASYFSVYDNIWHHSDFIEITDVGAVKVYGRSDATLNRGGVRIGSSEIYQVVQTVSGVQDSLVVHLDREDLVFLFVVVDSELFTDELQIDIKTQLKIKRSPRHVPDKIYRVSGIPYTSNGKKMEVLIKKLLLGNDVLNIDSVSNPAVLESYYSIKLTV